jgi:hypothetical protein
MPFGAAGRAPAMVTAHNVCGGAVAGSDSSDEA